VLRCVSSTLTDPTLEPILPEELKEQLRIDYTDHDPELQHLITEARMWAEDNELGRVLVNRTVTEKFREFEDEMELRWPTVSSITSVTYIDTNGVSQTAGTSYYELGQRYGIGVCRLKYGQTWPSTRDQEDAVTIVYVAGYGATRHSVPLAIRQAIKCYATYRYDGSIDEELLKTARRLLGPHSAKR
jgi:uncharacterized phiE125 gp8 family phage protein